MFFLFGFLAFDFLVAGILLFLLGLRSRKGLALSQLWGIRTKRTMVDDETFARANRAIWRTYIFQGGNSLLTGLAVLFVGLTNNDAYLLLVLITIGSTFLICTSMVYGYFKAHLSIK